MIQQMNPLNILPTSPKPATEESEETKEESAPVKEEQENTSSRPYDLNSELEPLYEQLTEGNLSPRELLILMWGKILLLNDYSILKQLSKSHLFRALQSATKYDIGIFGQIRFIVRKQNHIFLSQHSRSLLVVQFTNILQISLD